jgi:hypothetical protein
MVKAYLKYAQHDVLGGLVSNTSNLTTCKIMQGKTVKGQYLVTAHNELVLFTNQATNEVDFKFYDRQAEYGHVTCLKSSTNLLAIGFSTGTILVIDLDLANASEEDNKDSKAAFATLHKFQFHRSAVSCMLIDDSNTTLYSGSQDTYIVTYDLVADQA